MKQKFSIKSLLAIIGIGLMLIVPAKASAQLIAVADSVGIWSAPTNINVNGQPTVIRSKVIKHFGTTCVFELEWTNNGTKTIGTTIGFLGTTGQLHAATAGWISLKPGETGYFKREKREVLNRGVKNDALACRNCNPTLGFYGTQVK